MKDASMWTLITFLFMQGRMNDEKIQIIGNELEQKCDLNAPILEVIQEASVKIQLWEMYQILGGNTSLRRANEIVKIVCLRGERATILGNSFATLFQLIEVKSDENELSTKKSTF